VAGADPDLKSPLDSGRYNGIRRLDYIAFVSLNRALSERRSPLATADASNPPVSHLFVDASERSKNFVGKTICSSVLTDRKRCERRNLGCAGKLHQEGAVIEML